MLTSCALRWVSLRSVQLVAFRRLLEFSFQVSLNYFGVFRNGSFTAFQLTSRNDGSLREAFLAIGEAAMSAFVPVLYGQSQIDMRWSGLQLGCKNVFLNRGVE